MIIYLKISCIVQLPIATVQIFKLMLSLYLRFIQNYFIHVAAGYVNIFIPTNQ